MYIPPVQFEDEGYKPKVRNIIKMKNESELVNLLIKKGWIKNRNVAAVTLLLVAFSFIFMSIFFFTGGEVFGFNKEPGSRNLNESYYINIPGVDEPVEVMPDEDLGEVLKRYSN